MPRAAHEEAKLKELVRQYSASPGLVIVDPSRSELPEFLRSVDYTPDMLVIGEHENLVVEVRSRRSMSGAHELGSIAELVERQPGWDFLLVYTNPKSAKDSDDRLGYASASQSQLLLDQAQALLSSDSPLLSAALLVAWAGFEGAVRVTIAELYLQDVGPNWVSLIRDAITLGVLPRRDQDFIEHMAQVRNQTAHGLAGVDIESTDVGRLVQHGMRVLQELSSAASEMPNPSDKSINGSRAR